MRILHIIPTLRKGGAERICLDLVRAQNRMENTESRVAILHDIHEFKKEFPEIKPVLLNSKVVPSLSGKWQVNITELNNLIREFKPDVIHSHLFEAEMVSRYEPVKGIRYFTHCHNNMPQFKRLEVGEWFNKKRITEAYERRFILSKYTQCNNRFIAISPDTQRYFKQYLPVNLSKNITMLPNAVDLSRFVLKSRWTEGEKIKLINIGSFFPVKNQSFLLEVMKRLLDKNIWVSLTLAGDGPERKKTEEKARQMGVFSDVSFVGSRNDIPELLSASTIYVHSGLSEAFGLVFIEAMAAGLPVVTLNGGGNKDLIVEGENGYLIEPPDAEKFADKILECHSSNDYWNKLSVHAQNFAGSFDIQDYNKKLIALYKG